MTEEPWYHHKKYEICQKYKDMFIEHGSTYHLTFIFNSKEPLTPKQIKNTLDSWHKALDKALHGRNYYQLYRDQRTSLIAVMEHMESNSHCHAVLKTPYPEKFKAIAETFWTGHVASGHIHFSEMGDIESWANYMTKELMKGNNIENIYMSEAKERPKDDK